MTEMMERYEKENGRKPYFLDENRDRVWRESFVVMLGKEIATLRSLTAVTGETSDGYHTFNELYMHRTNLFAVICKQNKESSFIAKKHEDGSMFDGMFLAGVKTPEGYYTYHCENEYLPLFDGVNVLEFAPPYDGHKPSDIGRLFALLSLTRWHEGVPEEDGWYLVERDTGWKITATLEPEILQEVSEYTTEAGWIIDEGVIIRWAFLPKDEE